MDLRSVYSHKIILGSGSPRRKQLMQDMGFDCKVQPINADESFSPALKAADIALYLCEKKAAAFTGKLKEGEILLTADTIVWIDDLVLNKPAGEFEAKQMLRLLSGKMHRVFTGVCLLSLKRKVIFADETKVYFKTFSEEEIDHYIKHFKPFDKAGSYGAQDWLGLIGVKKIEGSYFNVMGLPVHRVYEELGKM